MALARQPSSRWRTTTPKRRRVPSASQRDRVVEHPALPQPGRVAHGLEGPLHPGQAVVEQVDQLPFAAGQGLTLHRADGMPGAPAAGQVEAQVDVVFLDQGQGDGRTAGGAPT
jgi:hypothetical protein